MLHHHQLVFSVTGKYERLGHFHDKVKKVLINQYGRISRSSIRDDRGYVQHYNLNEVQCNMVMASIDLNHLELIRNIKNLNLATKNQNDFTILDTGEAFISQRKTAELCGVALSTLQHFFRSNNIDVKQGVTPDSLQKAVTHYAGKGRFCSVFTGKISNHYTIKQSSATYQ